MQLQLNLMVDSVIDVNLMSTWYPRAPFPKPPHWRKIRKRKRLQQWRKNGTTWVQRDAIAFNRATVASRTVEEPMCVDSAGALRRYTDVGSVITIKSPLHLGAWERGLKLHPDESFVEYILDGIKLLSAAERRGTPVLLSAMVSDNSGNSPQVAAPRRPHEINQSTQRCSLLDQIHTLSCTKQK